MFKRLVGSTCAVVLAAGTLIAISASSAPALNFFVHGNVQCNATGTTRYTPPLRNGVPQTTKAIIKGTLDCSQSNGGLGGETGLPSARVMSGQFKAISEYFGGDCNNTNPPTITMRIKWVAPGAKIRDTNVSWALPQASSVEPYSYEYAGGTVQTVGVAGSYFGATAGASFIGTTLQSQACTAPAGKLKSGWSFAGASQITFESPPWVDSVTPNASTLGNTLDVDINGQDFKNGDTVEFSGSGITVNSYAFVNANVMTANITVDSDALAGMRDVTVTNSTLGQGTCQDCFMVAPTVTGVSPGSLGKGATDRDVTITGVGFAPGAISDFGPGITVNYTQFVSGTQLLANVNVDPTATVGARDVTVTDPGFGVGSCTGCFSVNDGPTVTSASPTPRGVGATGQVITINGTNFASGAVATFGNPGISVTSIAYVSPTQVKATINIAAGSAIGAGSVRVTNPDGGSGVCPTCFTVNKGPVITDWNRTTNYYYHYLWDDHHGGHYYRYKYTTNVEIKGTNFQSGATFSYSSGDVTINSTTFVSSTKYKQNITIDVQDYIDALPVDRAVTITNPDGGQFKCEGCVVLII